MIATAPESFACATFQGIGFQPGTEYVDTDRLVAEGILSPEASLLIRAKGSTGYFRNNGLAPADLAVRCVSGLLSKHRLAPGDIDLLVFTSTIFETTSLYPDLVAKQVARRCGCFNAKTFSLQQLYCVSPIAALRVISAYFNHEPAMRNAVLVCSDAIGSSTEYLRAIDTSGLHSDGAAALVLQNKGNGYRLLDVEVYADVNKYQGHNPDGTIINSTLNFAITAKLIRNVLARRGLNGHPRINLYANNLDFHAWLGIADILGIGRQRVYFNHSTGHVFGADPFINLCLGGKDDAEYCILAATGVAGTFGVALLEVPAHA